MNTLARQHEIGHDGAVFGHGIEMQCLNNTIAVKAGIAVEVIGHDHDDIGLLGSLVANWRLALPTPVRKARIEMVVETFTETVHTDSLVIEFI